MTFKSCIDTLGIMKGDFEREVTAFATNAITLWVDFISSVIAAPLPVDDDGNTKGLLALKTQVLKVRVSGTLT